MFLKKHYDFQVFFPSNNLENYKNMLSFWMAVHSGLFCTFHELLYFINTLLCMEAGLIHNSVKQMYIEQLFAKCKEYRH